MKVYDTEGKLLTTAGAKTGDNEVYGLLQQGLAANRPAAGIVGRLYYSTDTLILDRDTGTVWEEKARGETATRLAQLAEKAHSSLTGLEGDDHSQYLNVARHDLVARHPLSVLDSAVCSEAEADSKIATHRSDASAHHAKTGDNEVAGLLSQGLASARPAAGVAGRLYYSTDTKVLERDNGTTWDEVARGETVSRLAQLSEKAHTSLTGIGPSDHHAAHYPTLADHPLSIIPTMDDAHIPAEIARDTEVDSKITTHKGDASAHHTKTGNNEVYGLLQQGLAADKPVAAIAGRLYYSTDTGILERDTGTAWEEKARGETAIRLAQLSEKSHISLTDITANQHHNQSHDHSLTADGSPIAVAGVPNLDTSKITSGRFGMPRMPDGTSGLVLTAQGTGVDPVYAAGEAGEDNYARILAWLGI